jgi:hypothetical protein
MRIGEVMMQCQCNVRHNHRTRTTQFDLFAAPGGEAVLTPAWGALPEETRSAVTGLMVQLILDHADARGPQPEEAGHEL